MFKHAFATKSSNKLRSSEWRGLKSRLQYAFPDLVCMLDSASVWGSQTATSNPVTREQIIFNSEKFVGSLFWIEPPEDVPGNPFLLAMEPQEGILIPSLPACWRIPGCIPVVCTVETVMNKLYQGADLMAPGICEKMPLFNEGSVVGVALAENPDLVLAIGIAQMGTKKIMAERQGKAIKIIHSLGDRLWVRYGKPQAKLEPLVSSEKDSQNIANIAVPQESVASLAGTIEQLSESVAAVNVSDSLSDDSILEIFLTKLMEMELPVTASTLHSKYLTPALPGLDFKKTSWKSVTKFLKSLEKKKLLTLKERQGELLLTGFNNSHDLFDNVILPKVKKGNREASAREVVTRTTKERPAPTKNNPGVTEVYVEQMFKAQPAQFALFGSRTAFCGTLSETRAGIEEYMREKDLLSDDGKQVRLDDAKLCTLLSLKPLGNGAIPSILVEEAMSAIISKMKPMHRFSHRLNDIIPGTFHKIQIAAVTRQKRRVLTEILNLAPVCPLEDCQALFSVKCASAVSIDGDKLYIQGNHVRLLRFWAAENGFMTLIDFAE